MGKRTIYFASLRSGTRVRSRLRLNCIVTNRGRSSKRCSPIAKVMDAGWSGKEVSWVQHCNGPASKVLDVARVVFYQNIPDHLHLLSFLCQHVDNMLAPACLLHIDQYIRIIVRSNSLKDIGNAREERARHCGILSALQYLSTR